MWISKANKYVLDLQVCKYYAHVKYLHFMCTALMYGALLRGVGFS